MTLAPVVTKRIAVAVEYVVVWNGCRDIAPAPRPVAPAPCADLAARARDQRYAPTRATRARHRAERRRLARRNRRLGVIADHKPAIWAALVAPVTPHEVAARVGIGRCPVGVLLSKALRAGLVADAGRVGKCRRYVRAAAHASALTFPPIHRKALD